jgi:Tat protein translocase TatB subunit
MPNLGAGEILVILLLALLLLGPDKLPGAARSIGKGMTQFRQLSKGFEDEVRSAMKSVDLDVTAPSESVPKASSTLHPGLGPGPRLGAGEVVLDGTSSPGSQGAGSQGAGSHTPGQHANNGSNNGSSPTAERITGDGPSGSFS